MARLELGLDTFGDVTHDAKGVPLPHPKRGWTPPTRDEFEAAASPEGAVYVGSPRTVADKIVRNTRILGLDRFDLKFSNGTLPHDKLMRSIELYGTEVAPLVHAALESDVPASTLEGR